MPRLTDTQRREIIETAAYRIGMSDGLAHITHGAVATRCTVQTSAASVRRYYPRKADLWDVAIQRDTTGSLSAEAISLGYS